jgi:transposase
VAQCLEGVGHQVIVADPNYAPMYPHRRRRVKTNRRDAETLARACRQGTYRPAHRVSAARRDLRQQLTVRELLVRTRVRAIATMGALIRSEGLRVRRGAAEGFGARVAALTLPPALATTLKPLLTVLEAVDTAIAEADARIGAVAATDPVVQRLTTVPGVGPVTAAAFVATLDDVERFRGAAQVASYLGLVPSEASSADYRRRGPITKAGDGRLRWLLVQAGWTVWRSRRAAAQPLRAWMRQLAARRGKFVAVVAAARRLAGILYALWRDQTTFTTDRGPARARPAA